MDLRVSLVGRLIGFFLLLSALAAAAVMHALREDVAEEIEASALLAELMLSVAQAPDQGLAQITALIERGGLRHLDVAIAAPGTTAPERPSAPAAWLYATSRRRRPTRRSAASTSAMRPWSFAPILRAKSSRSSRSHRGCWLCSRCSPLPRRSPPGGRWARPCGLREKLERGLQNLASQQAQRLPSFELREFDRIAREIESIAERLAAARERSKQMGRRLIEVQEDERAGRSRASCMTRLARR